MKIAENQQRLQDLKTKRDELLQQKSRIESERQEFEDSVAEKGSAKLLEVQRRMGDVSATIARLQAQANAAEANINLLQRQKTELEQSSTEIIGKVTQAKSELKTLTDQHVNILKVVEGKQSQFDESSRKLSTLRTRLGEHNKEAEDLENFDKRPHEQNREIRRPDQGQRRKDRSSRKPSWNREVTKGGA